MVQPRERSEKMPIGDWGTVYFALDAARLGRYGSFSLAMMRLLYRRFSPYIGPPVVGSLSGMLGLPAARSVMAETA
jgi:hypothetical protein